MADQAHPDQADDAPELVLRPPILQRPTYLYGPDVGPLTRDQLDKLCGHGRPILGFVAATLAGVTAAYFVPKFYDRIFKNRDHLVDDRDGEPYDVDVDDE